MSALGGGLGAEMVMVLVVKIPQPIIELSMYLFGSSTPNYPGLHVRDTILEKLMVNLCIFMPKCFGQERLIPSVAVQDDYL